MNGGQSLQCRCVDDLPEWVDGLVASTSFAGVVRVDRRGREPFARAYGLAHRGIRRGNTVDTPFGIASGTKGLTALVVMALVEDGVLGLGTTARSLLGEDLPLVDDRVTVERGAYSTAADVAALWRALSAGRIVPLGRVAEMVRPRSDVPAERKRYGLGFWLHPRSGAVALEGYDAGVSFRSVCDPDAGITHSVISNWTDGAWPLARQLWNRLTP